MTLPTNKSAGQVITSSHVNAIATDVNAASADMVVVKEILYGKSTPYNLVGDNSDETTKLATYFAALNSATKPHGYLGPGVFRSTTPVPIDCSTGLKLEGAGRGESGTKLTKIVNNTTDVFEIGPVVSSVNHLDWGHMVLESGGAGHVLKVVSAIGQSKFHDLAAVQLGTAKSIWFQDNVGPYIDVTWEQSLLKHLTTSSVPAFYFRDNTSEHNRFTFQQLRALNSGVPFFHVECQDAANYSADAVFRDINFEVCNGGCIRALSTLALSIQNCGVYDLSASTTADLFYIGSSPTGAFRSVQPLLQNIHRYGGTLGTATSSTGTTTTGSKTVSSASGFSTADIGRPISGTGVPANTTVENFVGSTLTLSAPATGSASVTLTTTYCDIRFESGSKSRFNVLMNVGRSSLSGYAVDLGSNEAVLINDAIDTLGGVPATGLFRMSPRTARPVGLSAPDVQVFQASASAQTWTKPSGVTNVDVMMVAAGGGGGSGRRGAAGTVRTGGGGGGGGGVSMRRYRASLLSATETVQVGIGGPGGLAVSVNDTDGNVGTAGAQTFFKSSAWSAVGASGAGGGAVGAVGSAAGGATSSLDGSQGSAGGASSTTVAGASGGSSVSGTPPGATGGGAGGTVVVGDTNTNGGAGGTHNGLSGGTAGTGAGGSGGTVTPVGHDQPGVGGGGGAGGGGTGGAGCLYGGGGGGGGGSLNGTASGAGGAGGDGLVIVTSW